ncbi:DUF2971 domain-containing protein [Paraburkholderia sp. MM5482-R1]|uniref:DUF2971 domain-containing protein n=1 Tax=unclassified Paraburkholderia TaxID=2615204 RepID=UPI003D20ED5F
MSSTLYHYTDPAVCVSILQHRKIRLSARWHLNDPREGEDFGDLLRLYAGSKGISEARVNAVMQLLDQNHFYVACFSTEGDLLSQWRGYANDGMGLSIGFSRDRLHQILKGQSQMVVRDIIYADELNDIRGDSELGKAFETIFTHSDSPNDNVLQTLAKVRWSVKRKAYREESEFRVIFTPLNIEELSQSLGKVKFQRGFFGARSEIRDFIEVEFDIDDWSGLVTEVILGPKNRSNDKVVKDFLINNGLTSTNVKRSSAHYR